MNVQKLKPFFLLPLMALLLSCSNDEPQKDLRVNFKNYGLENKIIYELQLQNQKLYAATNDGLFEKNTTTSGGWEPVGLQGKTVRTFVFMPNGTCIASVHNRETTEHKLFKREGTGSSFQEIQHNFGGGDPEFLNSFLYLQDRGELLATGNAVIAKSEDGGTTWVPIHNDWQYVAPGLDFIEKNPHNGDLWAGGQNAIEGLSLIRYTKSTDSWKNWSTLLPSPSTAKDIAFDPVNAGKLYVGGEDGILKTEDNGETWTIIKQDDHKARFYFGLEIDKTDQNTIYAASWQKDFDNPQPLILYVSKNGGTTWREYTHPDPTLFGGVWDMVQVKAGNKTKLYLGLYKGGVFEATIE